MPCTGGSNAKLRVPGIPSIMSLDERLLTNEGRKRLYPESLTHQNITKVLENPFDFYSFNDCIDIGARFFCFQFKIQGMWLIVYLLKESILPNDQPEEEDSVIAEPESIIDNDQDQINVKVMTWTRLWLR